MPIPQTHSRIFSPSKSSTWLRCPLSTIYTEGTNEIPNEQAAYGSDTHELGAHLITKTLNIQMYDEEPIKTEDLIKTLKHYDEDMMTLAKGYVKYVVDNYEYDYKRTGVKPLVVVEQHLDFDFDDDAGGTLDCGILSSDGILTIIDLKTGRLKVSTYNQETKEFNTQLGLYSLAMYETFKDLYQIKRVRLSVYQPVINNTNSYEMDVEELIKWKEQVVLPAVAKIKAPNLIANPGPIQCKYCYGKGVCVNRIRTALDNAKDIMMRNIMTNEDYEEVLPKLDEIVNVCEAIKDEALKKAQNGVKFKNYKLVRASIKRKITNENEVIRICKEEKVDPYTPQKVAGITELQKRLGKDKFNKLISPLLTIQESGLMLVSISDDREEVIINHTEDKK